MMTQRLKAQRALKQLRQEDVAKYLKIAPTTYSEKENGKTDFTLTEIKMLLKLFNIKFEDLF